MLVQGHFHLMTSLPRVLFCPELLDLEQLYIYFFIILVWHRLSMPELSVKSCLKCLVNFEFACLPLVKDLSMSAPVPASAITVHMSM